MIDWLDIHALRVPLDWDYCSLGCSVFSPSKDPYARAPKPLFPYMVFSVLALDALTTLPEAVKAAVAEAKARNSEVVDLSCGVRKRIQGAFY